MFGITNSNWRSGLSTIYRRQSAVEIFGLLVFSLLLFLLPIQNSSAQSARPEVDVGKPLIKKVREWDKYTGRFVAAKHAELHARVSGFLQSIHFQDGQMVKKGDLLFVIDPRPWEAELAVANAKLASAQARLKLAKAELERGQELLRRNAISQSELDRRRSLRDIDAAEVLVERANRRIAQLNLNYTRIEAPFDGRVSDRRVDIGNLVEGGTSNDTLLTTLVALDPIYFVFDISERAFLKYIRVHRFGLNSKTGVQATPVYARLADEDRWDRRGTMQFIDNVVGLDTGTVRGRASFSNAEGLLQPGLFGELQISSSEQYEALLIPDRAILSDQAQKIVMAVDENDKVAMRKVVTGPMIGSLRVIREGLDPSDRIVVNGLQKVRSGMNVKAIDFDIKSGTDELPIAQPADSES